MSDKGQSEAREQAVASPPSPPRDWFLAAIEAEGSVSDSLGAVLRELERRVEFVKGLKRSLEMTGARGLDAITDLGQRIRALENTLRFRLGILRPERPAAWFRSPAATTIGPFSGAVLEEPVFATYDAVDAPRVKVALETAWRERTTKNLPFKDASSCLWRTLLGYAELLERIAKLPEPFSGQRLDTLPDGLPPDLESRALRAFLINVRNEMLAARDRLDACYRQLHEASEKLWAVQSESESRRPTESEGPFRDRRPNVAADSVREEFKRRRATPQVRRMLTPVDMDALRFMGFEDIPSSLDLRQRYLTMARQLHPDLHGGSDHAFKSLTRAYEHLTGRLDAPK